MGQADQVTYCHRKKMDMARIKVASISIPKCRITVTEGTCGGKEKEAKTKIIILEFLTIGIRHDSQELLLTDRQLVFAGPLLTDCPACIKWYMYLQLEKQIICVGAVHS